MPVAVNDVVDNTSISLNRVFVFEFVNWVRSCTKGVCRILGFLTNRTVPKSNHKISLYASLVFVWPFFVNCRFVYVLVCPFFCKLYISLSSCLAHKFVEELLRKMKERPEVKEREEQLKSNKPSICFNHPLCRAVTMAHYGAGYV